MRPTFLYIKQHTKTGLYYFGKTIQDPYIYKGSGKRWLNHIRKHGKDNVITCLVLGPYVDENTIKTDALYISQNLNIVDSKIWANLRDEDGLSGGDMSQVQAWRESLLKRDVKNEKNPMYGVSKPGFSNPNSKLTQKIVDQIRADFDNNNRRGLIMEWSKKLNIDYAAIHRICHRKAWIND